MPKAFNLVKRPKGKIISKPRRNGKLRPKDEAFCQAVASGMSGAAAYRAEIAFGVVTHATAQNGAWKLMSRPDIRVRVEGLRVEFEEFAKNRLGFGREQTLRYFLDGALTPLDEMDATHPHCQEYTVMEGEQGTITKVKGVGKVECMKEYAKLLGLYPQTSNGGGAGAIPAITINLGAMYSPAQALGEPRTTRTIQATVKTIAG